MKITKNIILVLLAFILVMLVIDKCNSFFRKAAPLPVPQTIVRIDTLRDSIPVYVPKPYAVIKKQTDTINKLDTQYLPTPENDYLDLALDNDVPTSIYSDTFRLNGLGHIIVKDTVLGAIKNRTWKAQVYSTTTTITKPTKRKVKAYIGAEAMGNQYGPLQYAGFALVVQLKGDNILKASAGFDFNYARLPLYGIGFYKKIKL